VPPSSQYTCSASKTTIHPKVTAAAWLLERLTLRGGRLAAALAVLLPFALVAAMAGGAYALFKYFLDSPGAADAISLAFGLMFLLVIYWPVLWLLNLAGYVVVRLYRRLRRPHPALAQAEAAPS
jgi:chromate transport protein ChrA